MLLAVYLATSLVGAALGAGKDSIPIYGACQSLHGPRLLKQAIPTLDCPPGTVFVSQTNKNAHFQTIQAAVESLPKDLSPRWILVDEGTYHESVNVSRKGPTTLLGATVSPHPVDYSNNLVTVFNTLFVNQSTQQTDLQDNADSAVLTVAPNKYAAWTGQGYFGATPQPIPNEFGTSDFRAYNINFENRAANASVGPALALSLGYSRSSFYGCAFRSWQDTVFVGKNASAYFRKSQILGKTDYIYGFGTAFFEKSMVGTRGSGCATGWKGTPDDVSAAPNYTNARNNFGAYFSSCSVVRSPDADPALDLTGSHCLGRPWNNLSRVVFENSFMDSTVSPAGFSIWGATDPRNETVFYAEHANRGPGYIPSERISFDHLLNEREAQRFTVERVFSNQLSWIDFL